MASTGISEFTFGYAFLFEQTRRNWGNLKAVPVLPSLQKEAEKGWDAHLPTAAVDYYYQFKLSDYLTRSNAKSISDGTYGSAYYRISLHRRNMNRQHSKLRALCLTNPQTYYVAPEFSTSTDFESAFFASNVTGHSRLIPLVDCEDLNDSQQHHITYQTGSSEFIVHSEPRRHQTSRTGKDLEELYMSTSNRQRPITIDFAEKILEKARGIAVADASKGMDVPLRSALDRRPERNRVSLLLAAAEILSIHSGVTLVLVGPGDGAA